VAALTVAGAALLCSVACATHAPRFSDRFITEGTPSVNLGGIEVPVHGRLEEPPKAVPVDIPPIATVPSRASGNLGTLEASSPRLQRALAALAATPGPSAYLDVAQAYTEAGVRDQAFDYLTTGLRHHRTDAALHDGLARLWRDWGQPSRALPEASTAVYYAPRSAEARNTLGTVLWALGLRDEAVAAFEAAVALDSGAAYAWRNLCTTALAAGRTLDATAYCHRANRLLPARQEPDR
jgi:Tfp pilus assembly protein PilF